MLRSLLTAVLLLAVPTLCQAAKVKTFQLHAPTQYDKAHFEQVVISNEGTLRLARELKPLASLDATHIWDIAEDKKGNCYVATGDEGRIYKVTPDGKVSVAYTSEDSQVLCLAAGADGSLYAGTGPGGRIIQLDADGKASVLCETAESYVWSLALDPRAHTLYAGTGPKGRILRITPEGKASVFCATKQEHILCLGIAPDGTLYAGTDKAGLVYRINEKGKGFVLYSAAQGEVRNLLVTKDAVYAGTSSPVGRRTNTASTSTPAGTGNSSSASTSQRATSTRPANPDGKGDREEQSAVKVSATGLGALSSEAKESAKATPTPAPSSPTGGENSLYRIAPDGTVREIFREKALILCQLREDGRFFVGTGMQGQLFEIDEASRERSEIARLDHGQILCLRKRHDGAILVGAGDPAKLYLLQDRHVARGTVTSDVLDARLISKWGSLSWRADTPRGTHLTVAVRSGNVAEPDDTWSEWTAEQSDPASAAADVPAGRFLQYRVKLATENPQVTPALRSITLRYATTNQAPEVTAIDVPDLDAGKEENPKRLKLKWTATDPNEDELTYSLYVRKDGWKEWVLLEDALEKREYEWDTTTVPSGSYQLKVIASDCKENPAEDALTGERISEPFIVSHTPPTVSVKVVVKGDEAVVEANAADPLVRLTSASFSINGKKWINVFPSDGLFDGKTKTFKFKSEALKPGTYVLVLRVRDAAANTGSGDAVFTVPLAAAER